MNSEELDQFEYLLDRLAANNSRLYKTEKSRWLKNAIAIDTVREMGREFNSEM